MNNHNFQISNCDTDSISFCSERDFTPEERKSLVKEINDLSPEFMEWADDGYYKKVIILAAKNYVLWDGKEIKYKGSAIKDQKKEPALREFLNQVIESILFETYNYAEIYNKYVKEILNLKDIRRWCSKKTLSSTTFESERANETKIIDAIKGTEFKEGDRIFVFFMPDGTLNLAENFNGIYDEKKLLAKLFKVSKIFDAVIPKGTFQNFALKNKKVQQKLENLR